jgi:hypothetical protein
MTPLWFWQQNWPTRNVWIFNLVEVGGRLSKSGGVRISFWYKDTRGDK